MIRAFVAITLPAPAVSALISVQAGIPSGHLVPPENFHITLAFLDEHPEPVIEDVHFALEGLRAPGFALNLSGVGMFGGKLPRLLFAGVLPEPKLNHLRRKVRQAARGAGLHLAGGRYRPRPPWRVSAKPVLGGTRLRK